MSNRNVLMIGNYLSVTRWNKNVWHYLAEKLTANGWDIIITSKKENQFLRLLDMLITIWYRRREYSVAQIDVFSGKAFVFAQCCSAFLHLIKKPFILTLHGGGLDEFHAGNPKRFERVLRRADAVVTPSPTLQKHLSSVRDDIRLIPNPIDISKSIYRVRKNAKPIFIWVRAFHEIYNPALAIHSVHQLINEFPDLKLIMIGPDKKDGSLGRQKKLIHALDIESHVTIVGGTPHSEIPGWLDKADVFINSTNYDAAPRSVLEAMANGLCVVSTNVGGIPFIIENEEEGLLINPNDVNEMVSAIRSILTEARLAEKLSRNAHIKAMTYDWTTILPRWESILREVMDSSEVNVNI